MREQSVTTGLHSKDVAAMVQAQLGLMAEDSILRAGACQKPDTYECQGNSFNCPSGKFDCGGNYFGCPSKFTEKG